MSEKTTIRQRPSERVWSYIQNEHDTIMENGGRLPTMRELAAYLGVSLATVQKVFQKLKEEGRIIARMGDGTYLAPDAARRFTGKGRRIFINRLPAMMEESASLQSAYYGALLKALSESREKLDLSFLDEGAAPEDQAKELFLSGELAGVILFPFKPCQPLIDVCDSMQIPYVTVHPANPHTTANFVTPDFFDAGVRLGVAIRSAGRKRVLMLTQGDVLPSTTAWTLVSGFCAGAMASGYEMTLEQLSYQDLLAKGDSLCEWFKARRDTLPDVIICHWTKACWVLGKLLAEMKVAVPEEVSLVSVLHAANGGDTPGGFTRFSIECDEVCREAVALLLKRIAMNGEPLPGVKVPLGFKGGGSTRLLENLQLGLC